jgi:hypothetical protein
MENAFRVSPFKQEQNQLADVPPLSPKNLVKPLSHLSPVESIRSPCPMSSHRSAIIEITANKGTDLDIKPKKMRNPIRISNLPISLMFA